jgi:hypothetical protein
MKAGLLITGSGPLVFLTSHEGFVAPELVEKFKAKGITKYIAWELPVQLARERYKGHFEAVVRDLRETDDLRILDYNSNRAFQLFSFEELGKPIFYE